MGNPLPPYQTIPGLPPATALNFTDQLWVNQAGVDARANLGDIAARATAGVSSFNGRQGNVALSAADLASAVGPQAPNLLWAGPATGAAAAPAFRALVGADLPVPAAASLGGVQSKAAVAHQWLNAILTNGAPTAAQPATTDLSDVAPLTNWTPALTFATPGDLAVTYSARGGKVFKIGPLVCFSATVVINTLTYTTASGALQITGLPYSATVNLAFTPAIITSITWPSGATMLQCFVNTNNIISFYGMAPNGVQTQLTTTNLPSGITTNLQLFGVFI